ncbi:MULTISPECIES: IS30 family transposase [Brevibacterium]|uniref:Transposase and inactivated derivatives, IS30 family n=2 Tax=Brevibacterium TaxID=1696 RepID=A0A1H1SBT2_BRESA|nr:MULTISPECIES: IS30 family transposase [Brevibacterium]UVI36419.1 IS30 family transposase [Brevibacterium spongiae]SDS45323.1 Transposase and inactivated derivatives, IS30 family [Brevibacterium sandarakinum]
MARSGKPTTPTKVKALFWDQIRAGLNIEEAAETIGASAPSCRVWFRHRGGVKPPRGYGHSTRYLTLDEREDIAIYTGQGRGVRDIARRLGRHPSTISRELARAPRAPEAVRPSRPAYRASVSQADADRKRHRHRPGKLATNLALRREVQARLKLNHSPEQIVHRLCEDFPEDPEMRVSHETIYQSLYVQGRGGLKRELATHLRTGRSLRKPHRTSEERRGRIPNMVNISQRPKSVEDRAVPGDWEGDLIIGTVESGSAIGTLVERATGFTMLLHLPGRHGAEEVADAMIAKMGDLPDQLKRSLTWDQGSELSDHGRISEVTGLDIYFCDPHSPWQRGTNENTNGLLRQYFPKSTNLRKWGPGYLDKVAAELNGRPRRRLGWATPAEALDKLLSEHGQSPGVATTA